MLLGSKSDLCCTSVGEIHDVSEQLFKFFWFVAYSWSINRKIAAGKAWIQYSRRLPHFWILVQTFNSYCKQMVIRPVCLLIILFSRSLFLRREQISISTLFIENHHHCSTGSIGRNDDVMALYQYVISNRWFRIDLMNQLKLKCALCRFCLINRFISSERNHKII